jgi:tetratricopeptide (TPR) repeat protein
MWVAHADAYYQLGEYDKARELFAKAIAADPWNRAARRLMADTEVKRDDLEAAFRSAAWAVIADPQSEAAWTSFRQLSEGTGRTWHRVYEEKPVVGGGDKPGDIQITLPFLGDEGKQSTPAKKEKKTRAQRRQEKAEQKEKEAAASAKLGPWMMYSMTKSLELVKAGGAKTPLEVERAAVEGTLLSVKEMGSPHPPFWDMMLRAKQAGYLDEAIFFHLMDAELAPRYREFREAHADRLLAYLTSILAEPPPEREPKEPEPTRKTG